MDEGLHFPCILGANTPSMDVGDQMRWKLKPNRDFDIWLFYNKLRASPSVVFLGKVFGELRSRDVSFFVWVVAWNKIMTGDNLILGGFDFMDCCIMCHRCGENVDHLLLHCGVLFLLLLDFRGSCLEKFQIFFLLGGIGWGIFRLISGI